MPDAVAREDPYASTVFISNLGSVHMSAQYHHLTNWGSNSVFVIIGEKHFQRFELDDGSFEKREVVDLSITVDERIADGIYFSNSVQLLNICWKTCAARCPSARKRITAPLREKFSALALQGLKLTKGLFQTAACRR